ITATELGVSNGVIIVAQGINAAGQVVGSFGVGGQSNDIAFLRQVGGTIVPFQVNNDPTAARGINDNGLITGVVFASGGEAFVGNSSLGFQLLQYPGATSTAAQGINNAGQIVGAWTDASGGSHGFIATPAILPTGTTSGGAYI